MISTVCDLAFIMKSDVFVAVLFLKRKKQLNESNFGKNYHCNRKKEKKSDMLSDCVTIGKYKKI